MTMTAADHPYTLHTLTNGLSIVIERMPDVRSVAAGFLVRTGARDETPDRAGVSHFLEHMMFKGTRKRTWHDITVDFDRMGSTYNAFTSEDRTVYYGWVRRNDFPRQLELLADMMQSVIPDGEFVTEKNVILEEIAMAHDNVEHVTFDFLQEKVFAGHSLAWPILGYRSTVEALTRDQMWEYFRRHYAPDNMNLIVAGDVDPDEVIAEAEKLCGSWERRGPQPQRVPPAIHGGVDRLVVPQFKQQIIALTYPSVSARDSLGETASAAAAILGGENSRFYWDIVQKGLSPRAGAHHLAYTDCGVMLLFGACEPDRIEPLLEAMRDEARKIMGKPVATHEVERVKNKRRTGLAIEAEAPYYRLTQLMDDMEHYGTPRTVEETLAEVDAITSTTLAEYFTSFPIDGAGHLTSVGPRKWPD
jgi:predicted Zn-dependent peptidase